MPELPDKLLGIDLEDGRDRNQQDSSGSEDREDHVRAVVFEVGDHRFAVPVDDVRTTTALQDEPTAVPRAPDAIEGVVDLRGEITAVIDPSVYFPPATVSTDSDQLLVFDQPADQQAAAIRVDDVLGVDSVPESNVFDEDNVAESEFSGDVLEHPLVDAVLERERRPGSHARESSLESLDGGAGRSVGVANDGHRIVVEGTPLVAVHKLLLASSPRATQSLAR
ncbi:chemotaxis protein CheW [Natronobacterium gregoryi]|uniref:Chemotaxis protein CheW n=2 Tax=Natronobacterium gregoryi TaxID=44930 RepID=L0AD50_NATGS|nr:chemotaxis protein CheW [Natronobacterium gregoryi]AFZ71771.1 chemotaxis signal transduction protein [Natronobacterium gregoryi SP2]ELY72844.1 chemotaxis protein CheW [Natronobacterium gregoryi SP2]PLK21048.1 chemotaxis protein CheW [Natronobacterium gregoryi SP2]SFI88205.1 Chemotaxis signal transduction protein [Natronobacterium gregoryi]